MERTVMWRLDGGMGARSLCRSAATEHQTAADTLESRPMPIGP